MMYKFDGINMKRRELDMDMQSFKEIKMHIIIAMNHHSQRIKEKHLKQPMIRQLSKVFDRFPDKWIIFAPFM